MKRYFVTATGTGIGKTFVTAKLCRENARAAAIKPIISGYVAGAENDTEILLKAQGLEVNSTNINAISPWRFAEAISPDLAATRAGRKVDFAQVVEFCKAAGNGAEILYCEGAGGVMSPLVEGKTNLDLIAVLGWDVILVTGNYLGSISHTLTALEVLKGRNVEVVINSHGTPPISDEELRATINKFRT